jgi:hypothetical protein
MTHAEAGRILKVIKAGRILKVINTERISGPEAR